MKRFRRVVFGIIPAIFLVGLISGCDDSYEAFDKAQQIIRDPDTGMVMGIADWRCPEADMMMISNSAAKGRDPGSSNVCIRFKMPVRR